LICFPATAEPPATASLDQRAGLAAQPQRNGNAISSARPSPAARSVREARRLADHLRARARSRGARRKLAASVIAAAKTVGSLDVLVNNAGIPGDADQRRRPGLHRNRPQPTEPVWI
jgi:NAD(P)-dependent dehydrogenase (short-subunit alcohol dehydrogenase family)